jgi:hypothetical protein
MQSVTAPYNSSLYNLWVGRSKEDSTPNRSISPVDHCVPPIGQKRYSSYGALGHSTRRKDFPFVRIIRVKIRLPVGILPVLCTTANRPGARAN